MKIILDKNLDTERSVDVDNITERPFDHILTGTSSVQITKNFPKVAGFESGRKFATLDIVAADGAAVPVVETYNRIADFSISYRDDRKQFSVSITLEYAEKAEATA